jgi:hypothetical protein
MKKLVSTLEEQFADGVRLDEEIRRNLRSLGLDHPEGTV